jgi:hypothetical protein
MRIFQIPSKILNKILPCFIQDSDSVNSMPASNPVPSGDPTPMDHQPHSPLDPAPPEEEGDEYDNSGKLTNSFLEFICSRFIILLFHFR